MTTHFSHFQPQAQSLRDLSPEPILKPKYYLVSGRLNIRWIAFLTLGVLVFALFPALVHFARSFNVAEVSLPPADETAGVFETQELFFFRSTLAKAKKSKFLDGLVLGDLVAGAGSVLVSTKSVSLHHATGISASFFALQLPEDVKAGEIIHLRVPEPHSPEISFLKPGEAFTYITSMPLAWIGTGKSTSDEIGTLSVVSLRDEEIVCDLTLDMSIYEKGSIEISEPYVKSERLAFQFASRDETRESVVFPTF